MMMSGAKSRARQGLNNILLNFIIQGRVSDSVTRQYRLRCVGLRYANPTYMAAFERNGMSILVKGKSVHFDDRYLHVELEDSNSHYDANRLK